MADPEFRALDAAFQSKISLAVELVAAALEHILLFETVRFDACYLAPELLEVLSANAKHWISLLKNNRRLITNSFVLQDAAGERIRFDAPHIKVQDLVPLIPPAAFKPAQVSEQTYYCFSKSVRFPTLGKVLLVISFANPELTSRHTVLVSSHLSWGARKIIETYLLRWPIEAFYQDAKQRLGLNEYRMRSDAAIQKHWSLVNVAYSFLHLRCLPASRRQKVRAPIQAIRQVIRQQSQYLMEALILRAHGSLSCGVDAQQVFSHLFAKKAFSFGA